MASEKNLVSVSGRAASNMLYQRCCLSSAQAYFQEGFGVIGMSYSAALCIKTGETVVAGPVDLDLAALDFCSLFMATPRFFQSKTQGTL